MKQIGLTGGIASGKSLVSTQLRELGAVVIDTDILARRAVEPGQPTLEGLRAHFGEGIFTAAGTLDRSRLGDIIFNDPQERKVLNQLLHPPIREMAAAQAQAAAATGTQAVVFDVPLLIETGWYQAMHEVWLVYVDEETQLTRLQKRDNISREQALARIHSQMPLADKTVYAHIIIDNGGSLEQTFMQVRQAWSGLQMRL